MIFKSTIFVLVTAAFSAACNNSSYGEKFETQNAVPVNTAIANFTDKGTKEAIVTGEIAKVCQTEGCWFNYKTKDGEQFVDFDHKFKIPMNTAGKTAISKGHFFYDTTSIEQLKEYAKDDGKTEKEIGEITAPEIRLVFRATGVVLDPKK
jgi:hypothetical protein